MIMIKKILKHMAVFFSLIIVLYLFLVAAAAIPNEDIRANMKKSVGTFSDVDSFEYTQGPNLNSIQDNYADIILLGVAWNMGEGNPFVSALDTKYYLQKPFGVEIGLAENVNNGIKPNQDYTRYWHGMSGFVRFILKYANVNTVKTLGYILALIFALITVIMLVCYKKYRIAIAFIISILMVHIQNIELSMEYQSPFTVGFMMCILYLIFERKGDKYLSYLSLIGGVLVAFFDFLTTETITILLPLIMVVAVRAEDKRLGETKPLIYLLFTNLVTWGVGYGATYITKWAAASIVTGENKFITALNSAQVHLTANGSIIEAVPKNTLLRIPGALGANLTVLFGGTQRLDVGLVLIGLAITITAIALLYLIFNKKRQDNAKLIMLSLSAIVFVRYIVLSSHSYVHEFFTYRALISVIFAILCAITLSENMPMSRNEKRRLNK